MANLELLRAVRQGKAAIEKWRNVYPDKTLDLSGVDLSGADLGGAKLGWADLRWANLSRADLRRADIIEADLGGANLSGADLGGAFLSWADLRGADLRDANVDRATLYETILANVDLSAVRGLESLNHQGPSVIDERTLRQSWPLPEVFLRGCGLSDELIRYLPSLFSQAIEFYSCFISYSSQDQPFAQRLHNDLQDNGVRNWFAPKDLPIGAKQREFIDESIRVHDKLLLVLSEHSVKSGWVEKEVATAIETHEKTGRSALFPIRLDDAVMQIDTGWPADVRRIWNIGDFRSWKEPAEYQQAFERLLSDLKAEGEGTAAS